MNFLQPNLGFFHVRLGSAKIGWRRGIGVPFILHWGNSFGLLAAMDLCLYSRFSRWRSIFGNELGGIRYIHKIKERLWKITENFRKRITPYSKLLSISEDTDRPITKTNRIRMAIRKGPSWRRGRESRPADTHQPWNSKCRNRSWITKGCIRSSRT